MTRSSVRSTRKEYPCCKCGRVIQKGEKNYVIQEFMQYAKHRCMNCGAPSRSELTSSEHLRSLYAAQEDIHRACGTRSIDDIIEALGSAVSTAEEEEQAYQESIDNKEEYFPGSSDDLEEKRQACEDWGGELQNALDTANEYSEHHEEEEEAKEGEDATEEQKESMEPINQQLEQRPTVETLPGWTPEEEKPIVPATPATSEATEPHPMSADEELNNLITEVEEACDSLEI